MILVARRNPEVWFWQVGGDLQRLAADPGGRSRICSRGFWEPRVDLIEDENGFQLRIEMAGVKAEDVQLLYLPDSHSILIRGVRKEEECFESHRASCHLLEIYYGEFEREIELPSAPIEPSQVRAQFRNGFLYVLAPKASPVFRHTKVSIRKV